MTLIKVCGLTREEDVVAAKTLGADWLGFIHVPDTPRFVPLPALAALFAAAEGKTRVLVVRNGDPAYLAQLRAQLSFEYFQFHGDEPQAWLTRFGGYRVFHLQAGAGNAVPPTTFGSPFLLDTSVKGRRGGTGKTFDWEILPRVEGDFLVAGGLTPENVTGLVAAYQPWGVDVSSGVEARPGSKDHHKLKCFIENVRRQVKP